MLISAELLRQSANLKYLVLILGGWKHRAQDIHVVAFLQALAKLSSLKQLILELDLMNLDENRLNLHLDKIRSKVPNFQFFCLNEFFYGTENNAHYEPYFLHRWDFFDQHNTYSCCVHMEELFHLTLLPPPKKHSLPFYKFSKSLFLNSVTVDRETFSRIIPLIIMSTSPKTSLYLVNTLKHDPHFLKRLNCEGFEFEYANPDE